MRVSSLLIVAVTLTGCLPRGGTGLFAAVASPAFVTGAIVSSRAPSLARVALVPECRPDSTLQSGNGASRGRAWVWVQGEWLELPTDDRFPDEHT